MKVIHPPAPPSYRHNCEHFPAVIITEIVITRFWSLQWEFLGRTPTNLAFLWLPVYIYNRFLVWEGLTYKAGRL